MGFIGEGSPNTIENIYEVRQQIPPEIQLKNCAYIRNELKAEVHG
jgi:hypothetical protein